MSVASTIPTPTPVVLIRVFTQKYTGMASETPTWHILGTRAEVEFEYIWEEGKDLVLGYQGENAHILDVTDLGLDPHLCLAFADDTKMMIRLYTEEDDFNLHSDPHGRCHCGTIDAIRKRMKPLFAAIDDAVKERFDAWTRRRHLVALADSTGMLDPSSYFALNAMVPEPVECESPKIPSRPVATTASEWLMAP
jgi:hypothetical protein